MSGTMIYMAKFEFGKYFYLWFQQYACLLQQAGSMDIRVLVYFGRQVARTSVSLFTLSGRQHRHPCPMDTLFLCFLIFALPYFKVFVASRVHLTLFKPTIIIVVKLPYIVTIVLFLFQKLHLQERILSDVVMCYFSSDDTRVRHNAAQTLVK